MKGILKEIATYFDWFYIPHVSLSDILEIIIISYLLYHIIIWFKKTRAWTLAKGIIILVGFSGIAAVFRLNTLLWLFKNTINVGIIAIIILFQPELRRALEELGRKNLISDVLTRDNRVDRDEKLNGGSIQEIIAACMSMSKSKTGALIVIEKTVALGEYESTGISLDSSISRQLIVNIFEKNTPLHDGAIIIRNNRIVAATCYLPLTNRNDLNKDLGTRHRAALGISEVSDSITIIVSEESGAISLATQGILYRNLDAELIKKHLLGAEDNVESRRQRSRKKGGKKNETKASK